MKRICVNCGSSPGFEPRYLEMAARLGRALADRQYELVYGGADVGLMGQVADSVLKSGGIVRGIIPKAFAHRVSHRGLTELHVVGSMHERKTMMFDLADAFIALPGGFGTLEEIFELLTWAQLGLSKKPCGIINVNQYFDSLLTFLDGAVADGFVKQAHRQMLLVAASPEALLEKINTYEVPSVDKWIGV
jgi:uncharacterized protein (TIGR00730 family)